MTKQDKWYGIAYVFLFVLGIPLIVFFFCRFVWSVFSDEPASYLICGAIGFIASGVFFYFFTDKTYVYNAPYTNTFWRDPLSKKLIRRGPDELHFRAPWEIEDATTRHERQIKIPISGVFETMGVQTLNVQLSDATLIFEIPVEHAEQLRRLGRDMTEIEKEIREQFGPFLKEAVTAEIAKRSPEEIHRDPHAVSVAILDTFKRNSLSSSEFSAFPVNFSLGDPGFTDGVNEAREQAFKLESVAKGAESLVAKDVTPDLAAKLAFGALSDNELKVAIYDVAGVSGGLAGLNKLAADAKDATSNALKLKGADGKPPTK